MDIEFLSIKYRLSPIDSAFRAACCRIGSAGKFSEHIPALGSRQKKRGNRFRLPRSIISIFNFQHNEVR